MYRRFLFAGIFSLAVAGAALAYQVQQAETPAPAVSAVEAPSADVFAQSLISAIDTTLAANAASTDFPALKLLLEGAIEAAFVASNAAPDVAADGVDIAEAKLTTAGTLCELPSNGIPASRCEAVAQAFIIARKAVEAAQTDATSATETPGNAALGAPPTTGSGGGGGGITHPPVAG